MNKHCVVFYRGPLERSRLAFILDSVFLTYTEVDFVWLTPILEHKRLTYFNDFIAGYNIRKIHIIVQRLNQFLNTYYKLRILFNAIGNYDLILVGFSTAYFGLASNARRKIWFINGIPEEKQMTLNNWLSSLTVRASWIYARLFLRPDLIVTVSERMSNFVVKHFPGIEVLVAPTCVDTSIFRLNRYDSKNKKLFVYMGSGSPWQAIDLLSLLWREIHQLDKSIQFRVISRDPRCLRLGDGITEENIEFLSAQQFNEVAAYLAGGQVGFLIRRPHIVNEVSFPTKLGEYIASGLWVVCSDLNWDVSEYIRKYKVGSLVDGNMPNTEVARQILSDYYSMLNDQELFDRLVACKHELDRTLWSSRLSLALEKVGKKNH